MSFPHLVDMLKFDTFLQFHFFEGGGGGGRDRGDTKKTCCWLSLTRKTDRKDNLHTTGGNFSARGPSQHNFMFFSCTLSLFSFLGKWTVRAWRRSPKLFWQLPFTGKARGKDNTHIREWSAQFASLIHQVSTNSKVFYPSHKVFIRLGKNGEVRDRGDTKKTSCWLSLTRKTDRKGNLHTSGW